MGFLDKAGRWLIVIGLVVIFLALRWKDLENTGATGMVLFATGCMIIFRRHKSIFTWE